MHKFIQLISNFLYKKNMPPSLKVYVHYTLYEFDEKQNYIKKFKVFKF